MSEKATKSSTKAPAVKASLPKQAKPSITPNAALNSNALSNPGTLTQAKIIALQRTAGNGAVQRLLAEHQVQAKLTVGPANDHYEQEADRVATQVMSQPAAPATASVQREAVPEEEEQVQAKPLASGITPFVQREATPEEEKEEIAQAKLIQREAAPEEEKEEIAQAKLIQREAALEEEKEEIAQAKLIQREAAPEEEKEEIAQAKLIQREAAPEEEKEEIAQAKLIQREAAPEEEEQVQAKGKAGEAFEAGEDFERRLNAARSGGQPIPEQILVFMESRFGTDFSNVRIHTGSEAIQLTREIGAQAFTRGNDIYLGAGKENLESNAGQELLAHELTHVVQQTRATSK